jgi:hypothetical protein
MPWVVDNIDRHARIGHSCLQQTHLTIAGQVIQAGDLARAEHAIDDAAIAGQKQAAIDAEVSERSRQGAGDIREAAGLDQRAGFGGGEQDGNGALHGISRINERIITPAKINSA